MQKLVQINTVCNGSTGRIMGDIQKKANEVGFDTISFYGRRKGFKDLRCEKIGSPLSFWIHVFINTILDKQGYGSYFYTKKLIRRLKEEKPDIIHLHNIHGYYINVPLLFNYLKVEYTGKLFWTFHDCWPFTGHCPHFTIEGCNKWKNQCYKCPNKKKYPISLFKDNSYSNYLEKKNLFSGLEELTIITPSNWLNKLVQQSFLKNYNIVTINNGIDLNVFQKQIDNEIKLKYNISLEKKILLGVASVWTQAKGYNDFIELSKKISKEYIIVLVGLTNSQLKEIAKYKNILGIRRTDDMGDLVKLYSIAYAFLNLTYEDTYPTVNLESIACGTPVISYNTGGCVEQINNNVGMITDKENLIKSIESINKIDFDNIEYLKKIDNKKMHDKIIKLYGEKY